MRIFFPIVLLLTASFVQAEVRLPDVIGSAMVLQQKQLIPIWGTAEPGESVTVTFGKAKKTVVADANGKWRVDLGKLLATLTPQTMTIAGKNTIVLKDILVGEVWLVAGQSNMQRLLRETDTTRRDIVVVTCKVLPPLTPGITPQEIAVSIVAELVAVKHGKIAEPNVAAMSMRWEGPLKR